MSEMLSKHFSADELRCPTSGECKVEAALLIALEELREKVGKPLKILSGYRSPQHNAEVGGSQLSEHTKGRAVDIALPKGLSLIDFYKLAESIDAFKKGGVGLYPENAFMHVDVRPGRARWARVGGKGGTPEKYVGIEVVLAALKQKGKA